MAELLDRPQHRRPAAVHPRMLPSAAGKHCIATVPLLLLCLFWSRSPSLLYRHRQARRRQQRARLGASVRLLPARSQTATFSTRGVTLPTAQARSWAVSISSSLRHLACMEPACFRRRCCRCPAGTLSRCFSLSARSATAMSDGSPLCVGLLLTHRQTASSTT